MAVLLGCFPSPFERLEFEAKRKGEIIGENHVVLGMQPNGDHPFQRLVLERILRVGEDELAWPPAS